MCQCGGLCYSVVTSSYKKIKYFNRVKNVQIKCYNKLTTKKKYQNDINCKQNNY